MRPIENCAMVINETDFETLVTNCRRGEQKAQEVLFKTLYPFAMQTALRYSLSEFDAADIVSESFLRVFKSLASFDPAKGSLHAWVKRIVINQSFNYIKARRKFTLVENTAMTPDQTWDSSAITRLEAQEILQLIRNLSPLQQVVFNLYVIEGYNHREVGEITGLKEGTSKWYLSEARRALQQQLTGRKSA
jgi:RNA polymerase sigma factor (sigma-70 family)